MSRTAPQNPNNIFTPNAITVATSTGFNQGDLVYQSNTGNFGRIPDNAISSDTFNVNQNSPLMPTPVNGGVVLAANTTGSSYGECAATLTNGNIVNVYVAQPSNNVAFKITDVNNTVVVAETIVSTVFTTGYSNPSVVALSGGGFAVAWTNTLAGGTLNSMCYAVYTNAGAVTLAATQDTTLGTFNSIAWPVLALGLPNGNFVLASQNGVSQMSYRIYDANGTPAYPASVNAGTNGYAYSIICGLAARSDSSILFVGSDGGTSFYYFIVSATNTAITNGSFTSTIVNSTCRGITAACLSDGTTFVLGYIGTTTSTTNASAFRFLPTGNTLSSETFFTNGISNTSSSYYFGCVAVQALASGNFMLLVTEYGGLSNYAVFNSSGVCISGASAGTPIPKRLWSSITRPGGQLTTIILTSTSINVYWTVANNNFGTSNLFGLVQSYVRLSLSTYDPIPVIGSTTTVATTTAGVSGYNIGTATPTNAKFSAASTSLVASSQPMAFVNNETTIASYACLGVYSATLTNGNFVVVYSNQTSPYPVLASIYTPSGTLVASITVASASANAFQNVRVAALSGGNFAVVYATGASSPFALTAAVYTASGSLVGTSIVATSSQLDTTSYGFSVSGITNNRFVVAYAASSGNTIIYRVLDSSCVSLATGNTGYSGQKVSVAGYPAGGFAICFWDGSTTQRIAKLNETSTNSFNSVASYNFNTNGQSNAISYAKVAVNSDNMATMMTMVSNAIWNTVVPYEVSSSYIYSPVSFRQVATAIPAGYNNYTSCFTAYGSIVTVCTDSTAAFNTYPAGNNVNTSNLTTNFGLSAGSYANAASQDLNLIPLYGNVVLFTYKNSSQIPKFVIFNATPYTATQQLTAGVTSSNGVALSQQTGYSLAGVAATTATAGGTGQIQTNGVATLNSSYNASTPAQNFDFQNNTGVGVKGTIAGRNVTLQGNI